MRRRNVLFVIAALVIVVVLGAIAGRRGKHEVAVRESVVTYGDFRTTLPETGVVQLPHVVTIPAGVSGTMGRIFVRAGDRTQSGALLATIENDQILSNVRGAEAAADSASGKARSVAEANAVLPEQNRSSIVQAQAAVVTARSQLTQAQQDVVAGSQSGLGYGGQTAEEQRLTADAALAKASTDLREARRTFDANRDLYEQKGISRDALMQSQARYEQAQVSYDQAKRERAILGGTLGRATQVLRDRVRSAQDGLRQATAALAAAQASARQSKAGDLQAARADVARAGGDLGYSRSQAERLDVRAPFGGIVQSVASQTGDSLRPIAPGDAVQAGQALFTLALDTNFVVRTKVDEQDVAGIRLGQRAVVSGEDFGGAKLSGHVVAISPIAQRSDDPSNTSRQIVTTIALDKKLPFLRDGMSVDVDIVTHAERHVLAVPADALRRDEAGDYVLRVRDGIGQRAAVKLGARNDTAVVVRSGIDARDTLVVEKNTDVVPGMAVKPAAAPTPA